MVETFDSKTKKVLDPLANTVKFSITSETKILGPAIRALENYEENKKRDGLGLCCVRRRRKEGAKAGRNEQQEQN